MCVPYRGLSSLAGLGTYYTRLPATYVAGYPIPSLRDSTSPNLRASVVRTPLDLRRLLIHQLLDLRREFRHWHAAFIAFAARTNAHRVVGLFLIARHQQEWN